VSGVELVALYFICKSATPFSPFALMSQGFELSLKALSFLLSELSGKGDSSAEK
jgi:hypothetical protein